MRRSLLLGALVSCSEPAIQLPKPASAAAITSLTTMPSRDDGLTPSSVRFSIRLTEPLVEGRVEIIAGGADNSDLAALAKNRPAAALRAREITTVSWSEGSTLVAQPTRALAPGRSTLVILQERRAPLAVELSVASALPLPTRVWTGERSVTYCGANSERSVVLEPGALAAHIVDRGPCFDIVADRPLASLILPPTIDPSPIGAPEPTPRRPEPPCPEGAYVLGGVCVRMDDDRIVILGGTETPRLIVGRIGAVSIGEKLPLGARRVIRGLSPLTALPLDLLVRDPAGERRVIQTLTTRPRRRHAVLNEVYARPSSGAPTQKYVELANDGEAPLDLVGLVLRDGADRWELPETVVAAGAFVLITMASYVDGLAGEPAPPKGVDRVIVEKLHLTGPLSLEELDGTVLSRFPATTSARPAAHARRTPGAPDDAPDAFSFAPPTPGRANVIPP